MTVAWVVAFDVSSLMMHGDPGCERRIVASQVRGDSPNTGGEMPLGLVATIEIVAAW